MSNLSPSSSLPPSRRDSVRGCIPKQPLCYACVLPMIALALLSGCDQGPPPTVPLPPPPVSISPGGGAPRGGAPAPNTPEAAAPAKAATDQPAPSQPAPITDSNLAPGKIELPAGFDPAKVPAQPTAEGAAPAQDSKQEAADPIRSGKGLELPPAAPNSSQLETKPRYRFVTAPAAPLQETADAKSAGVTLKASAWSEIAKAVSKTGKVTVVDLWSLACEPCLKEFPGLVKLHRELGDKVACASVNLDFDGRKTKPAESYRPRAEAFLASVKATFPNYLSTTASDEVFGEVGIDSIPAVMVFDANGKLIRTFSDVGDDAGFTYDKNVIPFVQGAVAKSP